MKINDAKPKNVLSEKVTVEFTMRELALITNALGKSSNGERADALREKLGERIISKDTFDSLMLAEDIDDRSYIIYEQLADYMREKGVYNY